MAYKDPQQRLAAQRAWRAKRKGKKGGVWRPGGPGRPPKGAKRMEPGCKLPGGKMRAEHVYDEDGLCDCGARRMEFAPRPELRPEVLRQSQVLNPRSLRRNATTSEVGKLQSPARPEPPAPRSVPVVAKRAAGPPATKQPKTPHSAAAPAARPISESPGLLLGGQPLGAIVADLEWRRELLDRAIRALREIGGVSR